MGTKKFQIGKEPAKPYSEMSNKDCGVLFMSRLDSDLLLNMLDYYNKAGLIELTEKQVLDYLHDKLNIL